MERVYVWVIIARLLQIAIGLAAMGISIALAGGSYWGYAYYEQYGNNNYLQVAAAWTSGGVALFGIFGLFGVTSRPDDIRSAHLYLLILFIDACAVALSIAAGTCLCIFQGDNNWDDTGVPFGGIVAAFLPLPVLFPLMARTIRLWWKRVLWRSLEEKRAPSPAPYYNAPNHPQELHSPHPRSLEPRQSYQTDDGPKGEV